MSNVDFIEVRGPKSLDELATQIGNVDVVENGVMYFELSADTVAIAQYDEGDDYPYMVSVESSGDLATRRRWSRWVFDQLAERTPWALDYGSDDPPHQFTQRPEVP